MWMLLAYILLIQFQATEACEVVPGSDDQTCKGQEVYQVYNAISRTYIPMTRTCNLTNEKVDGGFTEWTKWTSCSSNCVGSTSRTRTCHNPTPCNGGQDCEVLGMKSVYKLCASVKPEWGEWQEWSSCNVPGIPSGSYGTGTHTRYRTCENPVQYCTGEECIGSESETSNCRIVPHCLTDSMFSEKYLKAENPMVIYITAQVDIYLLTKNKCTTNTLIHNNWKLYKILNGAETLVIGPQLKVKFSFNPRENDIGLYRLYAKTGYTENANEHWMEDSMYVKIVQPPPHASIQGGAGRTIGEGNAFFNASAVSYSLENGPGNSDGIIFRWACLNFLTKAIYNLLKYKIDAKFVFGDTGKSLTKWYDTSVIGYLNDHIAYVDASTLPSKITSLLKDTGKCLTADDINVEVKKGFLDKKDDDKYKPLSFFYDVTFLFQLANNPREKYDTSNIIEGKVDMKPVNELKEFLNDYIFKDGIISDVSDFLRKLSESSLTLSTLYGLRELTGLPVTANDAFFDDLDKWLDTVNVSKSDVNSLLSLMEKTKQIKGYVTKTEKYVKLIGVDQYFRMCVNGINFSLVKYLEMLIDQIRIVLKQHWEDIEKSEKNYIEWMSNDLLTASACYQFQVDDNGTASLNVSSKNVTDGVGYLVYTRVEYEQSVSYFIQHAQTTGGNPPLLDLECRFNCMKKTAVTALMSLKVVCKSCTVGQSKGLKVWWVVKNFDLNWRTVSNNTEWKSWLLSEQKTTKFVIRSNVLKENSGYLIEAHMEFASGRKGTVIWIVETNMLPYGGTCDVTDQDAYWGEKRVLTYGWKDEGYRTSRDKTEDAKEQLVYKIVQKTQDDKYVFLYFGTEEENTIRLKPGLPEHNYTVTIKIQVFDIFNDYQECEKIVGQLKPKYKSNADSVSYFLNESSDNVNYYWRTGDLKQVVLNAEVAGTAVEPLNVTSTLFDIQPGDWLSIGVESRNGTETFRTFDELLDEILNPDFGDVQSKQRIVKELASLTNVLTDVTNVMNGSSTDDLDQIAVSLGTMVTNKDYTGNVSASKAFLGSQTLIKKLESLANTESYPKYEDYITTCEDALRILNNAMESILPRISIDTPAYIDIYNIMNDISSRLEFIDTSLADLTPAEKAYIALKIALWNELDAARKNDIVPDLVETLLKNMHILGKTLQMLNYRKQLPVHAYNGFINSTEDTRLLSELDQNGYSTDDIDLKFQETSILSTEDQNVQVTMYDHSPFSWAEESKFITSKTVTVSVGTGDLINTTIPSRFSLVNPGQPSHKTKTIQVVVPKKVNGSISAISQMLLYKMYWKSPFDSLIFNVRNAVEYLNHTVYICKCSSPSKDVFDWKQEVTLSSHSNGEINLVVPSLYSKPTNIYIGVLITSGQDETSTGGSQSWYELVNYTLIGATTGCRAWNDKNKLWDKEICKLSLESTVDRTECECSNNQGNTFATTFFVPPNTIDFRTVFDKFDIKNNAAVFATVIVLVCLYLLLCIWTLKQDRKDQERWALSYLLDNAPGDEYLYVLTVYTGLHRNSGTKSNVNFMVVDGAKIQKGERQDANVRVLDDGSQRGFETGSVRKFIMSVGKSFEEPSALKIWHDNSGHGNMASWYVNKILLEDVQTNEKFYFICNEWLSLDDENASIERAIPVSNKSERQTFSFLFNEKTRQNTTENHLWVSIVIRPEESNFKRVERLACCLAVLFLSMISNAMFFQQETGGNIKIGPISFSLSTIYISFISALICVPPIFLVTFLLRNAVRRKTSSQRGRKDKYMSEDMTTTLSSDLTLPFWSRYIAWILLSVSVIVPGFFLILYSMQWGKTKSEEWLLCFFWSFFDSVVIIDPIKIVIMSVLFSWIIKKQKEKSTKYDRDFLLAECQKRTVSPLSHILDIYKRELKAPLDTCTLSKMRTKRKNQLKMQKTFVELVLYLIFLAVLYMVSFSNRDPGWYFLKNHLDQHLVQKGINTSVRFDQIQTVTSLYNWLNDTLIPFLYPNQDENEAKLLAYHRMFIKDRSNFRVGPMRLRQVRVGSTPCIMKIQEQIKCYQGYSRKNEITVDHCVGWKNKPCARSQKFYNMSFESWNYVSSNDIRWFDTSGQYGSYHNGGYVAEFNVNYRVSKMLLQDLYKYIWTDRQTRAVFIEFTLYNVHNNVFLYASYLCELPGTGGVLTSSSLRPFRPYQHVGSTGVFILVCELLSLLGIFIFTVFKITYFCRNGKSKIKELWHSVDITIILLFFICFALYIVRTLIMKYTMTKFEEDRNKFVEFGLIAYWDEIFNIFLSCLIFLTTFRIMKILGYSDRINQLGRVLQHATWDLLGCFLVFFVVYTAFLISGHLLFGRYLDTYKNLMVSSTTLANAIIGKNSIADLFSVEPVIGRIYYFLFVLFLLWVLLNILVSTLNEGISAVRAQKIDSQYGVTDILINFWRNNFGLYFTSNKVYEVQNTDAKRYGLTTEKFNDIIIPKASSYREIHLEHPEKYD